MEVEGLTEKVYGFLYEENYEEAIQTLLPFQESFGHSRALLSLLGYSYYLSQDFPSAVDCYSELSRLFPEEVSYKLYHAQSLFKSGFFEESLRTCQKLKSICTKSESLNNKKVALEYHAIEKKIQTLLASIYYEMGNYKKCNKALSTKETGSTESKTNSSAVVDFDFDNLTFNGCVLMKQNEFSQAKASFENALKMFRSPEEYDESVLPVLYNVALCEYKNKDYPAAQKNLLNVLSLSQRLYPGLMRKDEDESGIKVGNSQKLKNSLLIEVYNLLFAISYSRSTSTSCANEREKEMYFKEAKRAMEEMPSRDESELDPVTLHNSALLALGSNFQGDFNKSIRKLCFLLENPPSPPETEVNLAIIYCKFGYFNLAADLFAEKEAIQRNFSASVIVSETGSEKRKKFLKGIILLNGENTTVEEGYQIVAELLSQSETNLRKYLNEIKALRSFSERDQLQQIVASDKLKVYLKSYEEEMDMFVPSLMQVAQAHWSQSSFEVVQGILQKAGEFCRENSSWRVNFAHSFFMKESSYRDCIKYYEEIVSEVWEKSMLQREAKEGTSMMENFGFSAGSFNSLNESEIDERKDEARAQNGLLNITAIVLANLCVAYIMTSQNEKAEELMKKLELEEEEAEKTGQSFHLCIVNLVIGTLYCSKGNFEFGISRIVKSLEPYEKKLGTDTWFYGKRGFLALIDSVGKQNIIIPSTTVIEVMKCLDKVENYGKKILSRMTLDTTANDKVTADQSQKDIASELYISEEARCMKKEMMNLNLL
eukprot:snap_masked-scaffold_47-processed-gene-1.54-mRNA-1 protein AED:0.42 eAED:0.44 QI:0/-1/0/1/-1/1/1/0/768